jgi:hypothetical protein
MRQKLAAVHLLNRPPSIYFTISSPQNTSTKMAYSRSIGYRPLAYPIELPFGRRTLRTAHADARVVPKIGEWDRWSGGSLPRRCWLYF